MSSLRTLSVTLASLLAGMVLFTLLMFFSYIHPSKFHSTLTPASFGIPYETVHFTTDDGVQLAGWLIKGREHAPTIVVNHGYPQDKGSVLPIVRFLYPDYNLFLFDFRSFGASQGRFTSGGPLEIGDYRAALAYLATRSDIRQEFGAYGFSMGAAVVLMAAAPQVQAVVADSPYQSVDALIQRLFSYFGPVKAPFVWLMRLYGRLFYGMDSSAYVAKITVPTLLIHGGADTFIPPTHSIALLRQYPDKAQLWIVAGAAHGMSYARDPVEYQRRVRAFFARYLQ